MKKTLTLLAVVVALLIAGSFQAQACTAGCTPGYWKNHLDSWYGTGYAPNAPVTAAFSNAGTGGLTMIEALSLPGGPGVEGARNILLRAAVASLLNAAKLGAAYGWMSTTQLKNWVNSVLASPGDARYWMLITATELDIENNRGCPIN